MMEGKRLIDWGEVEGSEFADVLIRGRVNVLIC
jgi:hypothetical protein